MRPLVSVVVPAHNPGRYIEPCVRSILRQSMPRDRFEVVFVDDGSTDETADRLDRLSREQPHIRAIHIPASGAPGRPRNVGLEAALGEYVQFLDADDELAPRALERLVRMARVNSSDIVLGKFASETMSRRQDLFQRNRPATTFAETPQLADASMGPTKLFRAALLRENEIAFPEGWRQMEDQLFTLRAYLAANVISILGDEPCYFFNKREDEGHISAELVHPVSHVVHLREIFDEIDAGVADDALRRRLTIRFYRSEMLARLAGRQFLAAPATYQQQLFDGLRALAHERIDRDTQAGLSAIAQIRSRLLLDGNLADILVLGSRTEAFTVDARVEGASWTNGRLVIRYRAILTRDADARPLTLVEREGSLLLDPSVAEDLVGPADMTDELGSMRAQLSVVDRTTALEWIVPGTAALSLRPVGDADDEVRLPALLGLVELDPQRVGPGEQPLDDGSWDVVIRWLGLGLSATGPLRFPRRARRSSQPPIAPALVGRPVRWVVSRTDEDGVLRIAIGGPDRLPATIDDRARRVVRDGLNVAIALPIGTDRPGPLAPGVLRLTGHPGAFSLPATFEGSLGRLVVTIDAVTGYGFIPRGRYELTAHLGSEEAPGLPVGAALIRDDGRFVILGIGRESALDRVRAWWRWRRGSAGHVGWSRAYATYRRLPQPARDAVKAAYRRFRG